MPSSDGLFSRPKSTQAVLLAPDLEVLSAGWQDRSSGAPRYAGGGERAAGNEGRPSMAGKVTTAAELEQMTPAERQAHFDASVITDLSQVPAEHLAPLRAWLEDRLAKQDMPNAS